MAEALPVLLPIVVEPGPPLAALAEFPLPFVKFPLVEPEMPVELAVVPASF